jgi:hypothetical protein
MEYEERNMMIRIHGFSRFVVLILLLSLYACGGHDDKPSETTVTVTGVAAAGSALSGTVYLKDSSSPSVERSQAIGEGGTFSIDVKGMKKPFLLKAVGSADGKEFTLFSLATDEGTANINPLTNLILFHLGGGSDLSGFYDTMTPGQLAEMADGLSDAVASVTGKLQPLLTVFGAGSVNPVTGSFSADHQGLDGLLDYYSFEMGEDTVTIVNESTGETVFEAPSENVLEGTIYEDEITLPLSLSVPTGVRASAGNASASLTWNPVAKAESYNIYWSTSPGVTKENGTKIPDVPLTTYQHTGLSNGTTYYYVVTSNNPLGESGISLEVSAKPIAQSQAGLRLTRVTVYNGEGGLISKTVNEYNAQGKLSKTSNYGATGEISNYNVYEYNGNGDVVKLSTYIINDQLMAYTTTEYNDAGQIIRTSSFGPTGFMMGYSVMEYGADGNVSRYSTFGPTGIISAYTVYTYNAAGDQTIETSYNIMNERTGMVTTEYNADGKEIKMSTYGPVNLEEYVTTEYYESGKVYKVSTFNGITDALLDYTVNEYDSEGNRIKVSNFDFEDQLTGYTTTEYNSGRKPVLISIYGPTGLLKKYTVMEYE